jgi:hypothetical protein
VEELATSQAKEETTHSWNARDDGMPALLRSFARADWRKKKWQYTLGYSK